MQINDASYINSLLGSTSQSPGAPAATGGNQFDAGRIALAGAYSRATELESALTELDQLIRTAKTTRTRAAWAGSSAALDLTSAALTATTLRSTEEVNTTPTSFGPIGADYAWQGASVAPPSIDGIYDGSNGSGTLTVEARRDGVHGENDLRFWVRDPGGTTIDNFVVRASHPIDQQYTLSNGLIFTLGEGSVQRRDIFEVEVFADVGSVVDPDKAFDGQAGNGANLQYGLAVSDGSFEINGVSIAVYGSDSLNDVLARISASEADVTAVFDAATESVVLSRRTPGSAYDITLANDNSGFLAATKLDAAVAELGTDGNADSEIGALPQFAGVSSGLLWVNDVEIALDVDADSLSDLLERITASDAAVSASVIGDRVYLQSGLRGSNLILDDGGTGLLDALHIAPGWYKPISRDGVSADRAEKIADATIDVQSAMDRFLGGVNGGGLVPAQVLKLDSQVRGLLQNSLNSLTTESGTTPGLEVSTSAATPGLEIDRSALVGSLRTRFSDVRSLFVGGQEDARQGFLLQLLGLVNQFTADTRSRYGSTGILAGLTA